MNDPQNLPIDIEEQQKWLIEHKTATGQSWTELAPKIGVKYGTISQFPNGGYKGDLKKIAEAVFRYRQMLTSQAAIAVEMPEPPSFFRTDTTRQMETILSIGHRGRMVVIAGGPGTSKTSTCRNYQAAVSNVWIATMKPSSGGISTMQYKVLEALGVEEEKRKGTPIALTSRIEALMANRSGLLILDEAQHLGEKALEEIRGWHDSTGAGIALVGNTDVLTRLTLGNRTHAFARLASRIAQRMIFDGPRESDALALADAWGIGDEAMRAFIVQIARQPGGLRTCTMMLETAGMLMSADRAPAIELAHMQDAWSQLSTRQLAA
ncbi:AAA family ATPase [Sphingomonas sp. Marseille-Q8236]